MPSRVTCLEYDVRGGAVIAHDKRNHILIVAVIRRQLGEVDTRGGIGRHRPGVCHGPISGIDRVGRAVEGRVGLVCPARVVHACNEASAITAIITQSVDVDRVTARDAVVDLEITVCPTLTLI